MKANRRQLAAYLLVVGVGAGGLWRAQQADEHTRDLVRAEAAEDAVEDAERCVSAWEARNDVRDMAEGVYRRNAETLLSFATDPERIAQYRELVERDVAAIRAELPNPECDIDAARAELDD